MLDELYIFYLYYNNNVDLYTNIYKLINSM